MTLKKLVGTSGLPAHQKAKTFFFPFQYVSYWRPGRYGYWQWPSNS